MKLRIIVLIIAFIGWSCNSVKREIHKNLNSRFTGFEIVEIKKDSASIFMATEVIRDLKNKIVRSNIRISQAFSDYRKGTANKAGWQVSEYVDSIYDSMTKSIIHFESYRIIKNEPCFYVKYRIFDCPFKREKEEYFYFRKINGKFIELLTRPYKWEDFLQLENYEEIMNEYMKHYSEIINLRLKTTGKI